jgi:hypothetical protein
VKISPRRRAARAEQRDESRDPAFFWWMPLPGLALAAGWGLWEAANDSGADLADRLTSFVTALAWPGLVIFAITTFLVWLAWKVDLD